MRVEVVVIIFCSFLGKAVHIELSDERVHVVVFEEDGKNIIGESLCIGDSETC